jgi:hypothetical protein
VQRAEFNLLLTCLPFVAPLNAARSSQRDDPTFTPKSIDADAGFGFKKRHCGMR